MLTPQKRKFGKALATGNSQTDAAIIAGYSEKTARSKGSQLAKEPEIAAYVLQLQREKLAIMARVTPSEPQNNAVNSAPSAENDTVNTFSDPLEFLKHVMNDSRQDIEIRKDAAKAMLPYVHTKRGEGGKKEAKQAAANKAADRFAGIAAPKRVIN